MRNLIILACCLVAACSSPLPDSKVCTASVPTVDEASAHRLAMLAKAKVPAQRLVVERLHVDACVRRWAWHLAPTSGSAEEIASAAMAGCAAPLRALQAAGAQVAAPPWTDLQTGDPISSTKALHQQVYARTVFYVIQGRAGGCRTK